MKFTRTSLLLLLLAVVAGGQSASDANVIRNDIESFYAAVEARDLDALRRFWRADSPFFPDFERQTSEMLARPEPVAVRNLRFTYSNEADEVVRQRVTVEIRDKPQNLTFLFARDGESWKIWRIRQSEDDLMHQLINAETEAQREGLLSDNRELQNSILCENIAYYVFELSDAGLHDVAYRLADVATASALRVNDTKCFGRMIYRRAGITFSKGELAAATKEYFSALEYARSTGDRNLEAIVLYYLAVSYGAQNNPSLSTDYLNKAADLAAKVDNPPLRRSILNLRALNTVDPKEKMAAFVELLGLLREAKNLYGEAAVLGNIADIYAEAGDTEKAIETMLDSVAKFKLTAVKNELVESFLGLSDFTSRLGRYDEALDWTEKAYQLARQIGRSPVEPLSRRFELNRRFGRPIEAEKDAREAVQFLEESRPKQLPDAETQSRFLKGQAIHYENLILILGELKKNEEALRAAELFKARALFDIIRTGKPSFSNLLSPPEREEQSRLKQVAAYANRALTRERQRDLQRPERVAELEVSLRRARLDYEDFQLRLYATKPELSIRRGDFQPVSLEEIGALFPDERTAFVEFAVTGEKTFVYVITLDAGVPTLDVHPIDIRRQELEKIVREFRNVVSDSAVNLDYKNSSRRLYDLLIKPAAARLNGKSSLVIVPDGFLWDVPFQALMPAPDRFLIGQSDISYAPSLTVLREMHRRPERRSAVPSLLAFGNPRLAFESAGSLEEKRGARFAELPAAEKEVDFLARLYGAQKTRIFKRGAATETVFKQSSGGFDILHFATHAYLDNDNPMYSAIVLSTTEESREDGLLESWELAEMTLNAELAVLSACETGRGVYPGEGIVGLSWAFFSAGVPRVAASQWQVDSASTAELMTEFHRRLRQSPYRSVPKALQAAMLKQMRRTRYRHPFYWAGFVTIGR